MTTAVTAAPGPMFKTAAASFVLAAEPTRKTVHSARSNNPFGLDRGIDGVA
jgi:hypothetical protein